MYCDNSSYFTCAIVIQYRDKILINRLLHNWSYFKEYIDIGTIHFNFEVLPPAQAPQRYRFRLAIFEHVNTNLSKISVQTLLSKQSLPI